MNKDIVRLTNRHQAKLLDSLEQINLPTIAITEIKKVGEQRKLVGLGDIDHQNSNGSLLIKQVLNHLNQ